jgi:hypothetical protein
MVPHGIRDGQYNNIFVPNNITMACFILLREHGQQ